MNYKLLITKAYILGLFLSGYSYSQELFEPQEPFLFGDQQQGYTTYDEDDIFSGYADADELIDEPDELDDSGNWYEKLRWFKSAKPKYEELKARVAEIKALEPEFAQKLQEIEKTVSEFYAQLRIDPTTIGKTLDAFIEEVKPKQDSTQLTQEERAALVLAADKQKELEQIKRDFESLAQLSQKVREAFSKTLVSQLKRAENDENEALDSFEEIEKTRNHEKAKDLYDSIENKNENIQAIEAYLKNGFRSYNNQAAAKIAQITARLRVSVDTLEKQGFAIKSLSQEEKDEQERARQKREEAERMRASEAARKKAEQQRWNSLSWWQKIIESIKNFFARWFGATRQQ
jgi:chromosome segregation ATPase